MVILHKIAKNMRIQSPAKYGEKFIEVKELHILNYCDAKLEIFYYTGFPLSLFTVNYFTTKE